MKIYLIGHESDTKRVAAGGSLTTDFVLLHKSPAFVEESRAWFYLEQRRKTDRTLPSHLTVLEIECDSISIPAPGAFKPLTPVLAFADKAKSVSFTTDRWKDD